MVVHGGGQQGHVARGGFLMFVGQAGGVFLKVVFFMPSSRETRVIDLAKFSSL